MRAGDASRPRLHLTSDLRLHGRQLARRVAGAADAWDPLYVAWYRNHSGHQGPVPPFGNRRRVAAWRLPYFFAGGQACFDDLRDRMEHYTGKRVLDLAILDLVCRPSRIAQYSMGLVPDFAAGEVDPTAIGSERSSFPRLRAVVSHSQDSLPFRDGEFDAVYAWSLWTHLPPVLQAHYLPEVHRILKPGGWAFITTNGHRFLDEYQTCPQSEEWWRQVTHEELTTNGMLYREHVMPAHDRARSLAGVAGNFGLSFHDPAYVAQQWGDGFEVVGVEEGRLANRQDLVVLRAAP